MESLVKEVEEGIRGTRITVEGEDEVDVAAVDSHAEDVVAAGEKK